MRAALLALLVCLGACDWSLHRMQDQPRCETDGTFGGEPCNRQPPDGVVAQAPVFTPPPVTRELVERGFDRFERFCSPCHGVAGDGDSYISHAMTVRRPPSLIDAAARSLPDDRMMFVIEHGYGLMPEYGSVLAPRDRFAIVHFLHALRARDIPYEQLTQAQREEARPWLQQH